MSHSSATIASTTQPLSDILPWGSPITVDSSSNTDRNDEKSNITASSSLRHCHSTNRTLLVTDACSADGRFLLHTLALQFLSSRHSFDRFADSSIIISSNNSPLEGAALWISCAPIAEKQIMMGLRKGLQHNLGGGGNNNGPASGWNRGGGSNSSSSFGQQQGVGNSSGRIHIVSMPLELADAALLEHEDSGDGENKCDSDGASSSFTHEGYLKQLYKRIVHWLNYRELLSMQQQQQQTTGNDTKLLGPNLIILDNATTLATLFGDKLANEFLSSVQSAMKKHSKKCSSLVSSDNAMPSATSDDATTKPGGLVTSINLLAIRSSSPDDGGLYQLDNDDENSMKGEKLRSEYARLLRPWLGFGSGVVDSNNNSNGASSSTNIILQMEEQSNYMSLSPSSVPPFLYRSGLYEMSDGIVDVSPLESGYARDVLGRLSFATTWSGKGWWGISSGGSSGSGIGGSSGRVGGNTTKKKEESIGAYTSICVNYRCDDSGVRVMRLRSR